ncbi:unnamed protein product [Rotaria magnacalcarata]|uniref:RNA-dependent RNA polymerase n=1 Tax=Rotaria magnacalcarata TaxID=392030 RepID=A0A816VG49_9BILA|nr:unnamed protein product [Rotaria magnacalcarata]CAF2137855.1 unnamed protein product [Rotaria magnacalcarata]CAF3829761.1 unnamed protein product [Rotaria magnacalcarata]CAF4196497.1 unnamed protein product [Rotaria magnacalcarata]
MASQPSSTELKYQKFYRELPKASTEAEKRDKRQIVKILNKISKKCGYQAFPDRPSLKPARQNQIIEDNILDLDQNIFTWSLVRTDFEYCCSFLPLLKQSNIFLDSIKQRQPNQACLENIMRFKSLFWSLFSEFRPESVSDRLESQHNSIDRIIKYYASIVKDLKDNYQNGSFIERFKILATLTKTSPVRLDLLDRLHNYLSNGAGEKAPADDKIYRLSARIFVDRHGNKYCSLSIVSVHKEFGTSRLTRSYGEESFLRVRFIETTESTDISWRFASDDDDAIRQAGFEMHSIVHNVSILILLMRDLCLAQSNSPDEFIKVDNELRKNVDLMNNALGNTFSAKWSASEFDCLEEHAFRRLNGVPLDSGSKSLKIAGRCFKYLMTTTSGVHKDRHIFSDKSYQTICERMFSKIFIQEHRDYGLKLSLRMGLWLTPSISMNLVAGFKPLPPISEENHIDGCGRVSISLAKDMTARWRDGKKYKNVPFATESVGPTTWDAEVLQDSEIEYTCDEAITQPAYYSAFQIRLDGIKGMLVVDKNLGEEKLIQLTKNQIKFKSPQIDGKSRYETIEIVQCSQPTTGARLNFALISLIVACAKDPALMEKYIVELAFEEIEKLLEDRKFAIQFALKHNDIKSFNMLGVGCSLLETFLAGYYQNYGRRFKISVNKSRRLFGVADFWNVLKEGEVFVKISNLGDDSLTGPGIKEQNVLVTKEPCFHRGDLRRYIAVTEDELEKRENGENRGLLRDLHDVLVFYSSAEEKFSEPAKICGSDLDGDQYFVCWDENILDNLRDPLFEPGIFEDIKKEELDKLYKKYVKRLAKKDIEGEKRQPSCEGDDTKSISSENTTFDSSLSPEDMELLRHHADLSDLHNDVQDEKQKLQENKGSDRSSEGDVESTLQEEYIDIEQVRNDAAHIAGSISQPSTYATIHELFDLHMRVIDNWKHEWVTEKHWTRMEKFCDKLSLVLDSPKSNVHTLKASLFKDLGEIIVELPKYPHFHPLKRKDECRHSDSALGQIYDSLQKHVAEKFKLLSTNNPLNFSTLYDEISEIKLSFLFHQAKGQRYAVKSVDAGVPHVSMKDIKAWYEEEIVPFSELSLLRKEAACTMLWKITTLLNLKEKYLADSNLQIFYLRNEENLSNLNIDSILNQSEDAAFFYCITERVFEEIKSFLNDDLFISQENSNGTLNLNHVQKTKLINYLSNTVEKRFWRDLQLPYPKCSRETNVSSDFSEIRKLFETQAQICLKEPALTGEEILTVRTKIYHSCDAKIEEVIVGNSDVYAVKEVSRLNDIVRRLLCFSETWDTSSANNNPLNICKKLDEISLRYIRLYKYLKVLENDRIDLDVLPRYNLESDRIDLSKLEMVDDEMQELFKLLYSLSAM